MEERVEKVTDKERVTAAPCGPDPPVKVVRTNCINNLLYAAYSEFGCLFIDSLHGPPGSKKYHVSFVYI